MRSETCSNVFKHQCSVSVSVHDTFMTEDVADQQSPALVLIFLLLTIGNYTSKGKMYMLLMK